MTFPETMPTKNAPQAHFVPFAAMTCRQRAEHLVVAHGMGVDYHGSLIELGLPENGTDVDVIGWYERVGHAGYVDLILVHEEDEAYLAEDDFHGGQCFAAKHTHDKTTQEAS